ncbi:MAG: hypothetical protein AAF830_03635 [Pseudomonadota bacterium]
MRITIFFAALLLAACSSIDMFEEAPHQRGYFQRADITKSSGIAASRKQAGVFWTINERGGQPVVYALDETGRDLGSFLVQGAGNEDWESLTIGACVLPPWRDCLYIGDTGDNNRRRSKVRVYHFPEPSVTSTQSAEGVNYHLPITYTDYAHDAEGMYMMPGGGLGLISRGRNGEVAIYTVGSDDWGTGIGKAERTMVLFDRVRSIEERVTGAALSGDGRALAVLTYTDLYIFPTDRRTGLPTTNIPTRICDLRPLGLQQSEAVTWIPGRRNELLITSTGQFGQVARVTCG